MVSHRQKRPHSQQAHQTASESSFGLGRISSSPNQIARPTSSLATRQILPPNAPCRQRYNAAFQALQNAYKQAILQRQNTETGMKIEWNEGGGGRGEINEQKLLELKRNMANCRERQRTEELNEAFKRLRRTIPSMPSDKMSKIHTLRIATEYIRFLDQVSQTMDYATTMLCGFNHQPSAAPVDLFPFGCGFQQHEEQTMEAIHPNQPMALTSANLQFGPSDVDQLRNNFNAWRSELTAFSVEEGEGGTQMPTTPEAECQKEQQQTREKLETEKRQKTNASDNDTDKQ